MRARARSMLLSHCNPTRPGRLRFFAEEVADRMRSCRPYEDLWDMIPQLSMREDFQPFSYMLGSLTRFFFGTLEVPPSGSQRSTDCWTRSADLCRLRILNRVYSTIFEFCWAAGSCRYSQLGGTHEMCQFLRYKADVQTENHKHL